MFTGAVAYNRRLLITNLIEYEVKESFPIKLENTKTMAGKQAKILSAKQIKTALAFLSNTRHPCRNKVMFLLSCKAGLRSVEISKVTWSMVTDSNGELARVIHLQNIATKGKKGGRTIPMANMLHDALAELDRPDNLNSPIIRSERGNPMAASTITSWFARLYGDLNLTGCSSHSGRRTCGTMWARKVTEAGGSLKDVQELMGHSSIQTTQRYIDSNEDAKRKLVELI